MQLVLQALLSRGMSNLQRLLSDLSSLIPDVPKSHENSKFVVGQDQPLQDIKRLLLCESGNTNDNSGIVGLCGMGGSGKTTLATVIWHDKQVASHFKGISFVKVSHMEYLHGYQLQICRDLEGDAMAELLEHRSVEACTKELKHLFKDRKVLLILDDLWCSDLEEVEGLQVVNPLNGSRILFTTRFSNLFQRRYRICKYDMPDLTPEDSLQLFCMKCFGEPKVPDHFHQLSDLVERVARQCGGLPLYIEVIGSSVACQAVDAKEVQVWDKLLCDIDKSLKNPLPSRKEDKMHHRLKISYDYLRDKERKCFLHFATVAPNYRLLISDVVEAWSAMMGIDGGEAWRIFRKLVQTSLVKLDSSGAPGRQLKDAEMALHSTGFRDHLEGTCYVHEVIRTMALAILSRRYPELLHRVGGSTLVSNLSAGGSDSSAGENPSLNDVDSLSVDQALAMTGREAAFLRDKRMTSVPDSVCLTTSLRVLDLSFNPLATLQDEITNLCLLQILRLDACLELEALPDRIGALGELLVLSLRYCCQLQMLPASIGKLTKLEALYAPGCLFGALPLTIGNLTRLRFLDVSSCTSIVQLPHDVSRLTNLEKVNFDGMWSLDRLPDFGPSPKLRVLLMACCAHIEEFPRSFCTNVSHLEVLDLQLCKRLKSLPVDIGKLSQLKSLFIEHCKKMEQFPQSMDGMSSLKVLGLDTEPAYHSETTQQLVCPRGRKLFLKRGCLPAGIIKRIRDGKVQLESKFREHSLELLKKLKGWTPLHEAIKQSHGSVMVKQIEHFKQHKDARDNEGKTPLHWAADWEKLEAVEQLLSRGADARIKDKRGNTPLHVAAFHGNCDCAKAIIEALMKAHASPGVLNEDGFAPIHSAAQNGHESMVSLLLSNGVNVDSQTSAGSTALMQAAKHNHLEVGNYLIENGASLDMRNKHGWTALAYASSRKHGEFVALLMGREAAVFQPNQVPRTLMDSTGARSPTVLLGTFDNSDDPFEQQESSHEFFSVGSSHQVLSANTKHGVQMAIHGLINN
ncbi:unnamed protein product [Ostreobium quekettii]|uniref:NB-ARC domain-containing protein n=1 Tax=Ostreobium quekettii TaxID=121088 RepID=A0A8S1IUZ9_9CHLO|nr:unnamed protein product [Ostreobium quekettii]